MKIKKSYLKRAILVLSLLLLLFTAFQLVYPDVSNSRQKTRKNSLHVLQRERMEKGREKIQDQSEVGPPEGHIAYLVKAVLISEDDKFWSHEGFDYEAMQKALEKDIKAKKFKLGGSTISQQLAKNLYLSPSKNPIRKIRRLSLPGA